MSVGSSLVNEQVLKLSLYLEVLDYVDTANVGPFGFSMLACMHEAQSDHAASQGERDSAMLCIVLPFTSSRVECCSRSSHQLTSQSKVSRVECF